MSKKEPTQTDEQNLGNIGESEVQLILRKYKWTADFIKSDFGEDIDCNIFIDNTRTNYHLRCQVKSTTKDSEYVKELKNGDFSVSISSGLLKAWLRSYFPVFLVVYEEETGLCYWTIPTSQVLENPSKLEKENPSIRILKSNIFDHNSKEDILNEVKKFYHNFLRLDESTICCEVTPILMPNYRVIPFHHFSNLIYNSEGLKKDISGSFIELLPAWMTVLKKLELTNVLPSIKFSSKNTNLDDFLFQLKRNLKEFTYTLKENEWLSFIISPIKIISNNSSWSNELTYWTSYSKIGENLVSDYEYNFETPNTFLKQISRRARSWDFCHCVNPINDLSIQFFGSCEITPSIQNIEQIHDKNIKGQLLLWECTKQEIEEIDRILSPIELTIKIIDDNNNDSCLIAITNFMFDPSIGIYSVAMDWDSFENGNVRNKLEVNNLTQLIPGNEYRGEDPPFIEEIINRHSNTKFTKIQVSEMENIVGFPLIHTERTIIVTRFQMIDKKAIAEIERKLKEVKQIDKLNFQIEFGIKEDYMWSNPICELNMSWTPELNIASIDDYLNTETECLRIFNEVLPTLDNDMQLKNTFEILHIAGEIGFDNNNNG